jgi:hypothetical protein
LDTGSRGAALGTIQTSRTVNCGQFFPIDIYVADAANLMVWNVTLHYSPAVLGIYARDVKMFLAASPGSNVADNSYGDQGRAGSYDLLGSDGALPQAPESGSGVLVRLNIGALAPGTSQLTVTPERFWTSDDTSPTPTTLSAEITVTGACGTPVPTPTPEPTRTPTPSPTPTPTPSTSATPQPSPTATPSPTPVPPPGTVYLAPGWNGSCYQGVDGQIGDAFAQVDGVRAVYRLKNQAFERWFPDRPELSNISTLSSFDPLLVLTEKNTTWEVTPNGDLPHSVALSSGWNNVCYLGGTKDTNEAATGISGGFTVIYTLASDQSWRRFVGGRPEVSNLDRLETFASVLILVDGADGALWDFGP